MTTTVPTPDSPPAAEEQPLPWLEEMPPAQIVAELDRYIVGQAPAKRSIAIAVRNRWRRIQAPEPMRDETTPPLQHHPDRADRSREDRDRAAAGPAGGRAVRQGGSVQVHRGGIRGPGCGGDGARSGRRGGEPGPARGGGTGPRPAGG